MNKEDFVNNLRDLLSKYDAAKEYVENGDLLSDRDYIRNLYKYKSGDRTDTGESSEKRLSRVVGEYLEDTDPSKKVEDVYKNYDYGQSHVNRRRIAQNLTQRNWEEFKKDRMRRAGMSVENLAKLGLIANDDGSVEDIDYDYYSKFDDDTLERVFGRAGANYVRSDLRKQGYR